jgi:AraC-like DNA-binding protein
MQLHQTENTRMLSRRLGISARRNYALFRRIALNRIYANRLVQAIQAGRLNEAERLIHRVVPRASLSLGAGFSSDFNFRNPVQSYGFGIFRPGATIVLRTPEVQRVARVMLPVIARLRSNRAFRLRILRVFRRGRTVALLRILRNVSGYSNIVSVRIDQFGFVAVVQVPSGARYNAIFNITI